MENEPKHWQRMVDANLNRAAEGLRVIEDVCRFVLDNSELTSAAKNVRHDLANLFRSISWSSRLSSRDSRSDVGRIITVDSEAHRENLESLLRANFERVKQSLRVLEEVSKIPTESDLGFFPPTAADVEQLRYRVYDLEKSACTGSRPAVDWSSRRLYALVSGCQSLEQFESHVSSVVAGGVDILQLRDKSLSDRELVQRALALVRIASKANVISIVNDRPDIAKIVRADGVHVGQDELPVEACRRIVGTQTLVGVSTHSVDQYRRAIKDGADYVGVGPVFLSRTKHFESTVGLDLVSDIAACESLPWFAIGGIDDSNLSEVLAAGAERVAVGSVLQDATRPNEVAEILKNQLDSKVNSTKQADQQSS